jgi:tetratricopeptide (TPR) repeat protein
LTPERWGQVKAVFDRALEAAPADRAAIVDEGCAGDGELRREVESLLASYDVAGDLLDLPAAAHLPADPLIGRCAGSYQLVRALSLGGLDCVYFGVRDEGPFRRVAVRAVNAAFPDERARQRFHNERQALEHLDHPNIARLLGGGETAEGIPYLVMEPLDGEPVDKYCEVRDLPIAARLQLFRTICRAVHAAHQKLLLHGDLNPDNVVVTAEGVPRLLNFGIARLLPADGPGVPYGSPERIRGEALTTSSDVYSLGALLYRILTGAQPLPLSPDAVEAEVVKPSEWVRHAPDLARRLQGDLDAIVLKAMSKNPESRYASAAHLDEEIGRHLEGLPVAAREGAAQYRAARFIARHKLATAAAACLVMVLAAGLLLVARARERSERRFEELRRFANAVLSDPNDKSAIAAEGLRYLDGLARDAGGDPSLERELIAGYLKAGDLQAGSGDRGAALAAYRKALALAGNAAGRKTLAETHTKLGDVLALSGDREEALASYGKARALYADVLAEASSSREALMDALAVCIKISGTQEEAGDPDAALHGFRECLPLARGLVSLDPAKRSAVAQVQERIALLSVRNGQVAAAEEEIRAALGVYEQTAANQPGLHAQFDLANGYRTLAEVQRALGQRELALLTARKSASLYQQLSSRSSPDQGARFAYAGALLLLIDLLHSTGRTAEARAETVQALQALRPLVEQPRPQRRHLHAYAKLLATTPFSDLRDPAAARRHAVQAVEVTSQKDPESLGLLAGMLAQNGDFRGAVERVRQALALLPPAGQVRPAIRRTLEEELERYQAALRTRGISRFDRKSSHRRCRSGAAPAAGADPRSVRLASGRAWPGRRPAYTLAPVRRAADGTAAVIREDHEPRKIFILRTQAVGDPTAHLGWP